MKVRTEGIFIEHHHVRKSVKAEFDRGSPAPKCTDRCTTREGGRQKGVTCLASDEILPGSSGADLVMNIIFIQTFKGYTLEFTLYECA